jgi:hypothetical protein
MVRDDVWAKIARKDEMLCLECFRKRADERQVPVSFADVTPCVLSVLVLDWTDMAWFERHETPPLPPFLMRKWAEAMQKATVYVGDAA